MSCIKLCLNIAHVTGVGSIISKGGCTNFQYLADPGEARGCSKALWRSHAQTVRDRSSSYNIDFVRVVNTRLNPKGHQNPISGLKVTAGNSQEYVCPVKIFF